MSPPAPPAAVDMSGAPESIPLVGSAQNGINLQDGLNNKEEQLEEEILRAEVTETHLKDLEDFSNKLNEAAKNVLRKKQVYDKVVSFVTYWSPNLAKNDRKFIAEDADALHGIFKDDFHFNAMKHVITGEDGFKLDFRKALWDAVIAASPKKGETNLFIFYYSGHADAPEGWNGKQTFTPGFHSKPERDGISWYSHGQGVVAEVACDFLFIFDCCFAGAMVSPQWDFQRRCEVLASSSPSVATVSTKNHSFTKALVAELRTSVKSTTPSDIVMIFTRLASPEVMDSMGLKQDPIHYLYSRPTQPSILLHPLKEGSLSPSQQAELEKPPSVQTLETISNARVLFKVTFEDHNDKPLVDEWERAIRSLPLKNVSHFEAFAVVQKVRDAALLSELDVSNLRMFVLSKLNMYCCFRTQSCTAIMSMPLWLWTYLARHPAYEAIAIIRSKDQLETRRLGDDEPVLAPLKRLSSGRLLPVLAENSRSSTTSEPDRSRGAKPIHEIEEALPDLGTVAIPPPFKNETSSSTGSASKHQPPPTRKNTWSSKSSSSSPTSALPWKGKDKTAVGVGSSTATATVVGAILSQERPMSIIRPKPPLPAPPLTPPPEEMALPKSWGAAGDSSDPFRDNSPVSKETYLKSVRKGLDRKKLRAIVSQGPPLGLFTSSGHQFQAGMGIAA